jgi:hypothetical protein
MNAPTERERRIETLKMVIAWNIALLEAAPKGSDPAAEDQLAADRDELDALLAQTEAA